jgi:hypothetical protein
MDRQMRTLKQTIESRYNCACRHAGSTHVREKGEGGLLWEGEVHTFELIGSARATHCFAFTVRHASREAQDVTAMSPPIKSPEWAVRVYLMQEKLRHDLRKAAAAFPAETVIP